MCKQAFALKVSLLHYFLALTIEKGILDLQSPLIKKGRKKTKLDRDLSYSSGSLTLPYTNLLTCFFGKKKELYCIGAGGWSWAHGRNGMEEFGYTDWARNEPSGNGDCGVMTSRGFQSGNNHMFNSAWRWKDQDCRFAHGFICEEWY